MKDTTKKIDHKKEQIQKAALKQFSLHGFDKTTMDNIAESIGMKKASLYYYYKNKESIFQSVIEDEFDLFIKKVEKRQINMSTSGEKLRCIFITHLELFHNRYTVFDLSVKLMTGAKSIMYKMHKNCRDREIALIISILREGIKSGEFKECDPQITAETIHPLIGALLFREMQSKDVQSVVDINIKKLNLMVNNALNLFIYGLKA
jgi:AcrR family transcriptional regulator